MGLERVVGIGPGLGRPSGPGRPARCGLRNRPGGHRQGLLVRSGDGKRCSVPGRRRPALHGDTRADRYSDANRHRNASADTCRCRPAGTDRDTHFDGGDANSDFRVDSDPRADSNHDGNPPAHVGRRSGRSWTSHLDADTRHSDADTRPLQNPRADADSYSDADGNAHQH